MIGLSLKYAKRDLEEKIKILDEKLKKRKDNEDNENNESKNDEQDTKTKDSLKELGDWRKIEIFEKIIKC